ncbi:hypothetical protein TRAPUB_12429 [Trametes pubescens]|uniref:Uncharacterized protein n=1 Tax=Trametes pubescens TaxID=154538 RepID=A0A1M2VU23_TRAPU|nr:hypothetical protein TRAPUB_12429 [Trametes pubescens]
MLKVLDHPLGARSRTFQAHAHLISRLLLSFVLYLFASSHILAVAAQDVVNGQDVRQGFLSVESPTPSSTLHAGSETDVSIDCSILSNTTLGIDLLEVYLVSSETQTNITVSSGPQLLSQEPGSTVKHIHWSIPTCLQTGTYNLTLYEASHLNDISYFSITPIPVQIQNTNVTDSCDSPENALQAQPQPSSPPPADVVSETKSQTAVVSPSDVPNLSSTAGASQTIANSSTATAGATASGNATVSTTSSDVSATAQPSSSSSDGGSIITITAGDGDITVGVTGLPGTIIIEPSGGGPSQTMVASTTGFITIFKTVAPTATATVTEIISAPVTITLEETYVSTVTASGTTEEFTVTQTVLSTTELVATQISSPQQAGLLPINSGSITLLPSALLFQTSLLAYAFLYVLWP